MTGPLQELQPLQREQHVLVPCCCCHPKTHHCNSADFHFLAPKNKTNNMFVRLLIFSDVLSLFTVLSSNYINSPHKYRKHSRLKKAQSFSKTRDSALQHLESRRDSESLVQETGFTSVMTSGLNRWILQVGQRR